MTNQRNNQEALEKLALAQGFSLFGVADITGMKEEFNLDPGITSKYSYGISLGKRLLDSVLETIKDRPNALYFFHYRQVNFFLDRSALNVASYIQNLGYTALPIAASQILDWEKQTSHVSHKKVAVAAGLGWIGRSNLLVNPLAGSRIRLVTILTDLPLEAGQPLNLDCGKCLACLKECPANAIKETPVDFDHIACYEKLREFRKMGIVGQFICGVCVRACPAKKPA